MLRTMKYRPLYIVNKVLQAVTSLSYEKAEKKLKFFNYIFYYPTKFLNKPNKYRSSICDFGDLNCTNCVCDLTKINNLFPLYCIELLPYRTEAILASKFIWVRCNICLLVRFRLYSEEHWKVKILATWLGSWKVMLESFKLESPTWNWKEWSWKAWVVGRKHKSSWEWLMKLENFKLTWKESMQLEI